MLRRRLMHNLAHWRAGGEEDEVPLLLEQRGRLGDGAFYYPTGDEEVGAELKWWGAWVAQCFTKEGRYKRGFDSLHPLISLIDGDLLNFYGQIIAWS